MPNEKIVTRPYSDTRFHSDGQSFDPIPNNRDVFLEPFFIPNKDWKPAETADIILISNTDWQVTFAHCLQKKTDDLTNPSIQLFTDDVILGNLNRDGFMRQLTFRKDGSVDRKKMIRLLKELRRYQNGNVLLLVGFHRKELTLEKRSDQI